MKISKERVEQILPENIKTSVLSDEAKNVLAMLMHSLTVSKGAQDTGVLVIGNRMLRMLLEMKSEYMMAAIRELEEYDIITRVVGKPRTEGQKATASEYHFNWDNIFKNQPRKKTAEELFSKFFKSSETPMGTAITTTIPTTITTSTTTSTSIPITTSIPISNPISKPITGDELKENKLDIGPDEMDISDYLKRVEELKENGIQVWG